MAGVQGSIKDSKDYISGLQKKISLLGAEQVR